jgi:hypothetical protein
MNAREHIKEEQRRREDQQHGDLMQMRVTDLSQLLGGWQKLQSYFLNHGKGQRYG